MMLTLQVQNSG